MKTAKQQQLVDEIRTRTDALLEKKKNAQKALDGIRRAISSLDRGYLDFIYDDPKQEALRRIKNVLEKNKEEADVEPTLDSAPPAIPTTLDRYELLDLIELNGAEIYHMDDDDLYLARQAIAQGFAKVPHLFKGSRAYEYLSVNLTLVNERLALLKEKEGIS